MKIKRNEAEKQPDSPLDSGLYLVGTPIGSIDDLAPRAVQILANVDYIAAEDTRRTSKLLSFYSISAKLIPFHLGNESRLQKKLISGIKNGGSVALVSDAGMPVISDPGYALIRAAHMEKISVMSVPGPSAVTSAVAASGIPCSTFGFFGYLPRTEDKLEILFSKILQDPMTAVFFESPVRIGKTISIAEKVFPQDRKACLCREISKKFEENIYGNFGEINAALLKKGPTIKGEITLVIAGSIKDDKFGSKASNILEGEEGNRLAKILMKEVGAASASRILASFYGLRKRQIYDYLNKEKKV